MLTLKALKGHDNNCAKTRGLLVRDKPISFMKNICPHVCSKYKYGYFISSH